MTELVFRHKSLFYFFLFVLVAGGVYSFMSMSKLEDPEIVVKQALVVTVYPGASAHEVELEVTDLVEKAIKTMGDVYRIESRSEADYSEVIVELHPTVGLSDVEQKWDILRRKVQGVIPDLPAGAQPPVVVDDFGDVYGLFYAMTSDGFSHDEMYEYGQLVKRELEGIADVKRVVLYGDRSPAVYLRLQQSRMAGLGVHPGEVIMALRDRTDAVYAGYYEAGNERIRVSVDGGFSDADDIRNLVIQGHEGDQFRLSDIATVERTLEKPFREAMRYNKLPALGISIAMESGGNVIELGDRVDEKLTELTQERIPAGIGFEKVFFQPDKVREAISVFMFNLLQSVAIVVFILMIAMGWRSGLIIGSGLLLTILGSMAILNLLDGTLQRVSLGSFIVAMGMLVDNAVVIVDGIYSDIQSGVKKDRALVRTVHKTAWPLLGATLIAILAFFPIFLSPDTAGEYVRDLFIVLAVSLLLSWVLALTQAPLMAAFQLRTASSGRESTRKPPEKLYAGKIFHIHRSILQYLLWHKTMSVIVVTVLLAVSVFMFRYVPRTFFPDMSYSQLYIEYRMPAGTRIEKVDNDLMEIEDWLMAKPEITNVTASLGGTPSRYNLVRHMAEPSMHYGELIVDFESYSALLEKIRDVQDHLVMHYPQAYVRVLRYNFMYKEFPVEVMFTGPDPGVLKSLASEAEKIMKEEPDAILVTNNWEPAAKTMVAGFSQMNAGQAGVSRSDVALSTLASTEGFPLGTFYEGNRAVPMYLQLVGETGKKTESLFSAPVFRVIPSGTVFDARMISDLIAGLQEPLELLKAGLGAVSMHQVVDDMYFSWEEPVVRRYNGQRAIKVQGNPVAGVTAEEVRSGIVEGVESIDLPTGYRMKWLGEYEASEESRQYLFRNLPLAIVLMIAILILLFNNYIKPLIIILSLPLAFIGIVPGMILTGREFGFVAIVGALGLMGMMIKNGVVLLEEVGYQLKEGKGRYEALMDASTSRLRPVMMASLTTILGMVPLLNDDMFGSLAVTMMSGLFLGSLITLMMMPVWYAVLYRIGNPQRSGGDSDSKQAGKKAYHPPADKGDNGIVTEEELMRRLGIQTGKDSK